MEYNIFGGRDIADLVDNVNEELKNGWKPKGGIVYRSSTVHSEYKYLQAMVRSDQIEYKEG